MEDNIALTLKEFTHAPFFAATPQTGSRDIFIYGKKWTIGAPNPGDPKKVKTYYPAFDIRHGKVIIAIISIFARDRIFKLKNNEEFFELPISMTRLCREVFKCVDSDKYKDTLSILDDLKNTWIDVDIESDHKLLPNDTMAGDRRFTIVGDYTILGESKRSGGGEGELWLESITFSKRFVETYVKLEKLTRINFEVLTGFKSKMAQTIYLYIPSRAYYHSEDKPFKITLTNLLQQIGCKIPKHKSDRYKIFTQNKHSIINQLNGKDILHGKFYVSLVETADKSDWNLCAWSDMSVGNTHKSVEFTEYEINCFSVLGIDMERKNLIYHLKYLKHKIGARPFEEICGDIKNRIKENKNIANPEGYLLYFLENEEWRIDNEK